MAKRTEAQPNLIDHDNLPVIQRTDPHQLFEFNGPVYDELLGKLDILIAMSFFHGTKDPVIEGLQEFKAWIEEIFAENDDAVHTD